MAWVQVQVHSSITDAAQGSPRSHSNVRTQARLVLRLLPAPTDRLDEIRLSDLLAAGEVACGDLGVDLDARVGRQQVICSLHNEVSAGDMSA